MWTAKVLHLFKPLVLKYIFDNYNKGYYEIDKLDFFSHRREKTLIQARRDYCHLAKKHTRHSTFLIGLALGKDHSTVLYHLKEQPTHIDRIEIE